ARPDGEKELLAVEDGYRESAESWKTLLRDLKRRGMVAPAVTVGDGALGFWAAVREVWPESREQACWCHKLANGKCCNFENGDGGGPERNLGARSQAAR